MRKLTYLPLSRVMAKARREERKSQTRRVVKPQPVASMERGLEKPAWWSDGFTRIKCPYGEPGDRLRWLTTWATRKEWDHLKPSNIPKGMHWVDKFWSFHESDEKPDWCGRLRPGRFLPGFLRHLLPIDELVSVRVERLQEISQADAKAEGLDFVSDGGARYGIKGLPSSWSDNPIESYRALWESINGPGSWDRNDWVWVLEFKP